MFNSKDKNFTLSSIKINKYVLYWNNKLSPYDTLTDEIKKICTNIKSCLTQLKNKNITHFTKKHMVEKRFRSILIRDLSININGIFTNYFAINQNLKI